MIQKLRLTKKKKTNKRLVKYSRSSKMFGGLILNAADENIRQEQMKDYLNKYKTKYSNALANYHDLTISTKFLLGLKPEDDIIHAIGNYLDDSFFIIDEEANGLDGSQMFYDDRKPQPPAKCHPNCAGIVVAKLNIGIFDEKYKIILQTFAIGHEIGHVIIINLFKVYIEQHPGSYAEKFIKNGDEFIFPLIRPSAAAKSASLHKSMEIICDLIGVALTFIAIKHAEPPIPDNPYKPTFYMKNSAAEPDVVRPLDYVFTANEPQLNTDLNYTNNANIKEYLGPGDASHPLFETRVKHIRNLLNNLQQIRPMHQHGIPSPTPDFLNKIRECIFNEFEKYLIENEGYIYVKSCCTCTYENNLENQTCTLCTGVKFSAQYPVGNQNMILLKKCNECASTNESSNAVCEMCGKNNFGEQYVEGCTQRVPRPGSRLRREPEFKSCCACTSENELGNNRCTACNGIKFSAPHPKDKQDDILLKKCNACTFANKNLNIICDMCQTDNFAEPYLNGCEPLASKASRL